jgi:glycosyltransferase involved in cell wall biosynthesis
LYKYADNIIYLLEILISLVLDKMKKLSIIIPVFNEKNTIFDVLIKVSSVVLKNNIEKEVIVVNDKSTDSSRQEVEKYIQAYPNADIRLINHDVNLGKGGALHTGIKYASGDYTIIQDADLELDPEEYNILIDPILNKTSDIVYGSRFLDQGKQGLTMSKWANGFLTRLSNFVFNIKITDMETCYKLVPTKIFQSLILEEQRFGFEPEITAKLAKIESLKWKEVAITYNPRTNLQGKKIGWKDGFRAIFCIVKYGWFTGLKSSVKE